MEEVHDGIYRAGAFFEDRECMHKACDLWEALSGIDPPYAKYRDKAGKYIG